MKLRSDQIRQARVRWGVLTLGVMLGMGVGFYVLWRAGDWALDRMVYQNPAFAIREIEVQTDGVIAEAQLRSWAGVKPGENLFALDLARVQQNLKQIPFIANAAVERILPKTLRVRVWEREAVAQVNLLRARMGGGVEVVVFHLDPEGFVMRPKDPRQRAAGKGPTEDSLPLLTGLSFTNLQVGQRLNSAQVAAGLRLISEFAGSPMAGLVDFKSVELNTPEVLVVTTEQGSEVTFGLQNLDRQLRRWRMIYDEGQRTKRVIGSLGLDVPDNIPLRWLEANSLPAPKLPKPLRSKKRHV